MILNLMILQVMMKKKIILEYWFPYCIKKAKEYVDNYFEFKDKLDHERTVFTCLP